MVQFVVASASPPAPVVLGAVCIGLLVVEHIYALVTPPYGLHGPFFFHLSFAVLYSGLGLAVLDGADWALITLTVLMTTQAIGRIFVWRAEDRSYAVVVKTILATGFAVTVAALALLWIPDAAHTYIFG